MTNPTPLHVVQRHAANARRIIEQIEGEIGSRFYGLENETRNGRRTWSIAPRAPNAAILEIKGTGHEAPSHIVRRWCTSRRAWRSIDLSTVRRIWYTDKTGTRREFDLTRGTYEASRP